MKRIHATIDKKAEDKLDKIIKATQWSISLIVREAIKGFKLK